MPERKLCVLSLSFLIGTAAAEYGLFLLWCVLFLFGLLWLYVIYRYYGKSVKTFIWCAAFVVTAFVGIVNSEVKQSFRSAYLSEIKDGQECKVQGEIYQKTKDGTDCCYYLKNCMVQFKQKNYSCDQILLYRIAEEYSIGEILYVKGNIKVFSLPVNEGGYNERAYYQSLKIDFAVNGSQVLAVCGRKNGWKEHLYMLREHLKKNFQTAMPDEDAGILAAVTLGDKTSMDEKRKKMYQDAGISHFYSISGLHISLLGMTLYHFLRKRGLGYLGTGILAAVFMFFYGEMIGFGISANRAIGMFLLLVYAKYRGRSYDMPTALAVMAAVLAGENPFLFHHAGYLLSFGAVSGVIFAGLLLADGKAKEGQKRADGQKSGVVQKITNSMKETFLVSLCIQIVTLPVMCQYFYSISAYAVFLNLMVLPCMGVLLGAGILGGILCSLFPFGGKLVLFLCHLILLWFDAVCSFFLKMPYASLITGTLPMWFPILWYGMIFAAGFVKKFRQKLFVPACTLLCVFLFFRPGQCEFELDFLDVGQGDGIYMAAGDGTHIFLDGGSADAAKVGTYRILPFLKYKGIRRIDYWFISHCDADHINGLSEIIESGYPIRYLVVSKYMPDDKAWKALRDSAEKKGISILNMDRGDAVKGSRWSIKCLAPDKPQETSDRNGSSLVLYLQHEKLTGFFGGDIGKEQEMELVRSGNMPQADVYKVSHHGSASSSSSAFLDCIKPKVAVVSCSMRNRYHHPAKETLKQLSAAGSRIYETRHMGQIKIRDIRLEAEGFAVLK